MRERRLRGWWWKIPLLLAVVVPVGWSAYGLAVHEPPHPRDRDAIVLPDPPDRAPTVLPPAVLEQKRPAGDDGPDDGREDDGDDTSSESGGQDVPIVPDPVRSSVDDDDDDDDYEDDDRDDDDGDDD